VTPFTPHDLRRRPAPPRCFVSQFSDLMHCAMCGFEFYTNDPAPPTCKVTGRPCPASGGEGPAAAHPWSLVGQEVTSEIGALPRTPQWRDAAAGAPTLLDVVRNAIYSHVPAEGGMNTLVYDQVAADLARAGVSTPAGVDVADLIRARYRAPRRDHTSDMASDSQPGGEPADVTHGAD
jgi:hypothetical protein